MKSSLIPMYPIFCEKSELDGGCIGKMPAVWRLFIPTHKLSSRLVKSLDMRFYDKKKIYTYNYLIGGLEHEFYFSIQLGNIGNVIIPIDELHDFSEG